MRLKTFILLLNLLMLTGITLMIAMAQSRGLERIPLHFTLEGNPDNWGAVSSLWGIAVVAWILAFILNGLGFSMPFLRRHPSWMNLPSIEKILALPEEYQKPYWETVAKFMVWVDFPINYIFFAVTFYSIRIAMGEISTLPWWSVWPGLALEALILAVYLPRLLKLPKTLSNKYGPQA